MRSKEEIENKIKELYELAIQGKINIVKVMTVTDTLAWVLGEDYLDTENL